jgi:hypothetical protein
MNWESSRKPNFGRYGIFWIRFSRTNWSLRPSSKIYYHAFDSAFFNLPRNGQARIESKIDDLSLRLDTYPHVRLNRRKSLSVACGRLSSDLHVRFRARPPLFACSRSPAGDLSQALRGGILIQVSVPSLPMDSVGQLVRASSAKSFSASAAGW